MPQVTLLNCDGLVISSNRTLPNPMAKVLASTPNHSANKTTKLFSFKVVASENSSLINKKGLM